MNYIKYFILLLFTLGSSIAFSQNCSVNAGGNVTICGTTHILAGSAGGNTNDAPTWTIVSKPAGAPDPVISDINSYTPDVTDLDFPGAYVFEISQPCETGTVTSQVTITAPGDVSTFTAGPDITNVSAVVGEVTLNGVIPDGYTGEWTAINIYNQQRFNWTNSQNATFSDPASATTTFSLIKKADHDVDPAYRVILTITSIHNPNCSYVEEAIVRFVPNPEIDLRSPYGICVSPTNPSGDYYLPFTANSPIFATRQSGASGNPAYGTVVTLNVVSQPVGGNISYRDISDERLYFDGTDVPGSYVFTITISNDLGQTYTTPNLTYTNNGIEPRLVSFLTSARPEQMMVYSFGGSGGELHCASMAGTNTPITFLFTIDPADPETLTTVLNNRGTPPPGGVPTLSLSGAGTRDRSVTVTPPAGGWSVGTYRIGVETRNGTGPGSCGKSQDYFIHISDGNRVDVAVDDMTVCYPGSGTVSATIPLSEIFKEVVNSSYFQGFNGAYGLTTLSRPAGAAHPTFEALSERTFTDTSTTISNLNREGEYVFEIELRPQHGGVGEFLDKEFQCSDAFLKSTFSIYVSTQVNANAGSSQSISCPMGGETTLNGNNPGTASIGEWSLISKPTGAPDPVIVNPILPNTSVTGLLTTGVYQFRWTITTGDCVSSADVDVTVDPNICTDIQVNKIGPVSSEVGSTVSYKIHVTNAGMGTATNVIVTDPEVNHFQATSVAYELGAGSGGSATAPASATIADLQGAGIVIPSMPSSSGVTFTVTGTVTGVVNDIIVNTATAEYEDDTDLSNNSATVHTDIYSCVGEESTYTFSASATAALATNVFDEDGGTIDLVYVLSSGDPVPSIGTEFTVPVTISEFRSHFGVDHKWLDHQLVAGGMVLTLRPDVSPNGINGWYDGLPPNNQQSEGPLLAHNRTDNVFTTRIEEGAIDELGRFSLTIGDYPIAPAGYMMKTEAFEITAAGDTELNYYRSGFWMKPLIQTGINPAANANILTTKLKAGDTYEWRYAAFSDGTDYVEGLGGRGMGFRAQNSVTFFKDCKRIIITNPILINQARR